MCRMYASLGVNTQLASQLRDFRVLAEKGLVATATESGHKAGWGLVVYTQGRPVYVARQPTNASVDPQYLEACSRLNAMTHDGVLLAHLRKAPHATVAETNTHPFTHDRWTFAHNGGIKDPEAPPGMPLEGTTDSERFFKTICLRLTQGQRVEEAIRSTVGSIRDNCKYSSLTFLLSDGRALYAYREYTRDAQYYTLLYAHLGNCVVLCQEPLWNLPWQEIPNRTLLTVQQTLRLHQTSL